MLSAREEIARPLVLIRDLTAQRKITIHLNAGVGPAKRLRRNADNRGKRTVDPHLLSDHARIAAEFRLPKRMPQHNVQFLAAAFPFSRLKEPAKLWADTQ